MIEEKELEIKATIAAGVIAGMLASPEWMELNKESARKPSNGSVPENFAKNCVGYTELIYKELKRTCQ